MYDAVRGLASREYRDSKWRRVIDDSYEDFMSAIDELYDGTAVFPNPSTAVGSAIFANEIAPFLDMYTSVEAMLSDLGEGPWDYDVDVSRWHEVERTAGVVARLMARNGGLD
ncbi:hypothetical protein CCO02nite_28090 [Cellulomonas composti]|uniref:Uncharacterized protein n=1 Tax=Cellulomonas composti TaxID=266130 RepID=A0A511JDT1_9CELL|nr:hypothetical protein [Cellulomonas composti]GEL96151.1 hypothetical protein CCO02nite_28090 [Cellulomonas composti]